MRLRFQRFTILAFESPAVAAHPLRQRFAWNAQRLADVCGTLCPSARNCSGAGISGTRARYLSKNQPVIFDRRFRPDPAHDPSVFTPAAYLQRLVFAYHSGRIPASTPDRDH